MENRQTILVVDDVAMFRELEALFLAPCGRVLTASNGAEALALVHDRQPDIVVLDLNLPDLDGEKVCRRIKADPELQDTPVIVVTGSGASADHERALRAGAADVLAKPLSRSALVDTVNRFVRFATPRGLPRADLRVPVQLRWEGGEAEATLRNLSRGGIFVETDCERANGSELQVEFELPDRPEPIQLSVQVMWGRSAWEESRAGLGLRFLDLDRELAGRLDDYVHEHTTSRSPSPAPSPAAHASR